MSNVIAAAAKSAARTAKIAQSYGLKKGREAKAAAKAKAIKTFYANRTREQKIAEWVSEKVKASYKGKGRKVRSTASAEAVAG